jgi:hypothetical protein
MTGDSVLELLRKNLRVRMNDLADHMASGACQNIEEYRHCAGKIEGLAFAEREILDMEERLKDD